MDSEELEAPIDLEKVTKTPSKGDTSIWKRRNPYWLWKGERKIFQRRCVDSEVLAAPFDLEKVNEIRVGAASEIINETPSTGDAWIRESTQPLLIQK